jgi:ribosome-associated translation inhibitor RaiA
MRTAGVRLEPGFPGYARERVGFKLGKFARSIERTTVRFEDVNGPRGGIDSVCRIKVVVSGMASVLVEETAGSAREAFDRALDRAERSVRRALQRRRARSR